MKNFIIATVAEQQSNGKWKRVGYKIYDLETDTFAYLKEDSIRKKRLKIENAYFENGVLKGDGVDLDRFSVIAVHDSFDMLNGIPITFGKVIDEEKSCLDNSVAVILGLDSNENYIIVQNPEAVKNLAKTVSKEQLYRLAGMLMPNNKGVVIANAAVTKKGFEVTKIRPSKKLEVVRQIRQEKKVAENVERPIKRWSPPIEKPKKTVYNYIEQDFSFDEDEQPTGAKNWKVRLIKKGEQAVGGKVHNSDDPLVEFYDLEVDRERYPDGRYVQSYFYSTLMEDPSEHGFALDFSSKKWVLNKYAWSRIFGWLVMLEARGDVVVDYSKQR